MVIKSQNIQYVDPFLDHSKFLSSEKFLSWAHGLCETATTIRTGEELGALVAAIVLSNPCLRPQRKQVTFETVGHGFFQWDFNHHKLGYDGHPKNNLVGGFNHLEKY